MNAEHLRKLKHELRTPVNHIVGYSELLLESTDDEGNIELTGLAKSLHRNGQTLARLLERSLLAPGSEMSEEQLNAIRDSLRPVIETILETSISASFWDISEYAEDLSRIRTAATQLLSLIGELKSAAAE